MEAMQERVRSAADSILSRIGTLPEIGLILGSGLGEFAERLQQRLILPTSSIPHYPIGTVAGHKGRLVFARTETGRPVIAFQGRIHFYECNDLSAVLFPIFIAHELGVKTLVITNAAGGVNRHFRPGDLMVIRDQINLTSESGLTPATRWGNVRRSLYDPDLVSLTLQTAQRLGMPVQCGVYAGVKGPSYETAAEVEMVHRAGGDAVGMSTVLEVRQAAALGIRILGVSCITNKATGIGTQPLDHSEVTDVAEQVKERFALLLSNVLLSL